MRWFIRDSKAVVQFNEEEMNSNHVMPAKDLASALGVSEMDLQRLAHERRLAALRSCPATSLRGELLCSRPDAAVNSGA